MKAWNIDANTINTGEIHSSDLNNLMVITREIKDYLTFETRKMFIVAPKGVGKTFLLKVKSQLFRDKASGFKFIPEETLCESFTSNDISFSEHELTKFTERSIWNKTWELCLYTLILKQFKSQDIPPEISNVVGEDVGVLNEILGAFLHVRGQIEKLHMFVATKLRPAVRKLRENSTANQIAIFIDNIDESFDSYVGFTAQQEGRLKASSIWLNAQISLLSVARDICRTNHHIKIFATVRSEAYMNFRDPLKLQIDDLCVELQYTKDELKEILIKNINLTDKEDLVSHGGLNPIIDMLGYDEIPHKFVEDDNGSKKVEQVFDFIYRHSYARPRDIVLIGKGIIEKVRPVKRSEFSEVSRIVNEQSYRLFEQLQNETIPIFEKEIFEKFCIKVKSNVIRFDDALQISNHFKSEEKFENVFSYFYRLGLIGIVESDLDQAGELKQTFLPVGKYSLTNEPIPEYQYFILHPSLNQKMRQIFDVGFYDRFNIIGYDYPFNAKKINRLENHFHFGLDRDSVTTILPNIQSTKCLALLVSPSADWDELDATNTLYVNLNGTDFSFQVYRDTLSEQEKLNIKTSWQEKKYHVVIYSSSVEQISFFFEKCNSASLCRFLQHAEMFQKLVQQSDIRTFFKAYLCLREYVERDFLYQENYLSSLHRNIKVDLILMDRYQYSVDHRFSSNDQVFRIIINAESEYNVMCSNGNESTFKNVSAFTKIHNHKEYGFFKKKHNLLTEAIYHFFKLVISNGYAIEGDEYEGMMEKFIVMQAIRTTIIYEDNELSDLSNGKTREASNRDLIQFGIANKIRVEKLFRDGVLVVMSHDLISCKEKGFFPDESQFYANLASIPGYYEGCRDFINLWTILDLSYKSELKELFISYSFKDSAIANGFADRLILMGVHVTQYEYADPLDFNRVWMHTKIRDTDCMMFLASKNSLTSDACHYELNQCILNVRQSNDSKRLLIIRLDDYVKEVQLEGVIDRGRKENIRFLREHTSLQNHYKEQGLNFREIDRLVKKVVCQLRKDAPNL